MSSKREQRAGKKYGEGVFGVTYDSACKLKDNETFCNILKHNGVSAIQLHSFESHLDLEKQSEVAAFIRHIHNLDCCVVKYFKKYVVGVDSFAFKDELNGMHTIYKIFGKHTEKYTTLTSLKLFGFNFVGAVITFKDNSQMHVTFSAKCDSDLENTTFTDESIMQLSKDILSTLNIMQRHDFLHCDLKPDNMIYCSKTNKYKIIDWGLSKVADPSTYSPGTWDFSSPFSQYLGRSIPAFMCMNIIYYSTLYRMKHWAESSIFKELFHKIQKDFDAILQSNQSKEELFNKYKHKLDVYNFGISLAYLIHKNKLSWRKHKQFVIKLVQFKDGFANAREAFFSLNRNERAV